jgi:ubiquitin carboxyl-terminal hydrolase L5
MAEWCTIESDPGLFTELIHNIGVKGVQVEEIIDMDILEMGSDPVYGLIFLFKYVRKSEYNPNVLSQWDPELYFANQVITNACATQAILSVLMNNSEKIDIGPHLKELKEFSKEMSPMDKGLAISNSEVIKAEHNKFSRPEPFIFSHEYSSEGKEDVFHFVGYIHFKDAIYEIDGLRKGPILIESNVTFKEWITKVKPHIMNRIATYANNEIKFNLLAIVPNKLEKALELEKDLKERKMYLESLIKGGDVDVVNEKYAEYNGMDKEMLEKSVKEYDEMLLSNKLILNSEKEKLEIYRIENDRRRHNYIPFIFEVMRIMAEKGKLKEKYDKAKETINEKKK